jgi:hypothetical protein
VSFFHSQCQPVSGQVSGFFWTGNWIFVYKSNPLAGASNPHQRCQTASSLVRVPPHRRYSTGF